MREIRVRPVVRYVITDFTDEEPARRNDPARRSIALGTFDSAEAANRVAVAVGEAARAASTAPVKVVSAPALRIEATTAGWRLREAA